MRKGFGSFLLRLGTCLMLLFAWTNAASSQPGAGMNGVVVDETGTPLAGATVALHDVATGLQRYGVITDVEGVFTLASVQSGRYALSVSYVGYATHQQVVDVKPGETQMLQVHLSSRTVQQPDVVITATRARDQLTPVTFSNLTLRELENLPDMKDLPVLLSTLPSITYHSENGNGIGYSTLRLRGFDQRRVAISINGIPQNDPEDFNVFWVNFFDIQGAIQDIQVQRGAGASFYGPDGIAGGINIVAVPYKPYSYARAEAGYGAFGTRRYTVEANSGLLGNRYVAFGRYSRLLSDGYRDWSWSEFHRFFAGVVRYGDRSTLTVQAYGGPQRDGLAFSGIPKAENESDEGRRANFSSLTQDVEHFHQPHIEVLHDWTFAPGWDLKQTLFGTKGEGYFDFGGTYRSPDYLRLPEGWSGIPDSLRSLPLFLLDPDVSLKFRAYLDQWQVGWLPRITHRHATGETTLGGELRLHRSTRWGRIQEAVGIPAELVGSENDVRVYQFHGEKTVASLFGSHLFRPVERVAIQGDVQLTYRRYRHYDERFFGNAFRVPYLFLNPRLGITINPEKPLSAYASIALANREPRMKSLYDGEEAGAGFLPQFKRTATGAFDFESPLIKPERLLDIEAGIALAKPAYRLAGNVFWMDFHDEIVPSGGLDQFGVPRSGNADRTRHIGVELEAYTRLFRGLDLRANATLSRNRFVRFTEYAPMPLERDGNPIAGFPERIANLMASYTRSGITLTLDAKYAGKQYIDNSGGKQPDGTADPNLTVDPYLLVNGSLRYAFPQRSTLQGLEFSLDVNNVLNEKALLYGNVGPSGPQFFPTATRHLFASIRYTVR